MAASEILLPVIDYDLAATLDSGQVFRWRQTGNSWHGIIGRHSVQLTPSPDAIHAVTAAPVTDWNFLHDFLQTRVDLSAILKTFPADAPMNDAIAACPGLRLLRQDPWECLASFILSSTKQIVQIRQIVALLCELFGEPAHGSENHSLAHQTRENLSAEKENLRTDIGQSVVPRGAAAMGAGPACCCFPTAQRIAVATEAELRACKMGFRAPGLLRAAREIAEGRLDLEKIRTLDYAQARAELMKLHGVGGKIADCVLLFAYGFDSSFPVDVWVERALQKLYFPRRRASDRRLRKFAATHFGPHAGYAQQYLFHYMRTKVK